MIATDKAETHTHTTADAMLLDHSYTMWEEESGLGMTLKLCHVLLRHYHKSVLTSVILVSVRSRTIIMARPLLWPLTVLALSEYSAIPLSCICVEMLK